MADAPTPAGRSLLEPHPDRLPLHHPRRTEILDAHKAAMEAAQPGYLDPVTGLFVMTAAEHVRRGACCANDCRHCPYC
ncbi:MAG: DUF5522 domain-containing protein [Actinomycetota bacterium]